MDIEIELDTLSKELRNGIEDLEDEIYFLKEIIKSIIEEIKDDQVKSKLLNKLAGW